MFSPFFFIMKPNISDHFKNRSPSAIREAQIIFSNRVDKNEVDIINLAIGNISLPMHPSMIQKMKDLGKSTFSDGIVKYTPTVGTDNARNAFLEILSSLDIDTSHIYCNVTDGGSAAMELMLLGVCGPSSNQPIMLLDPAYTNYIDFSKRLTIPIVTNERTLNNDGSFEKLDLNKIKKIIKDDNPAGLVVIPYDNPSGQYISKATLIELCKICVENNIWIISDEAYRTLYYGDDTNLSTIWNISEQEVKGITGRRISIESSSKVWNACGLRIGALMTDNLYFHEKSVSEYTANLSANAIGQEIFGALKDETKENLLLWYKAQQNYYKKIMFKLRKDLESEIPGLIISNPQAAIYFIIDFKNIVNKKFDSVLFTKYCAEKGKIQIEDRFYSILLAPMKSFYQSRNLGRTQMRLAMVEPPEKMNQTAKVLKGLFYNFIKSTN